jgi:demethylmenaquinone methyltransferase/2-methoxy-6-polyprenyl-1,4-benzoquinol methylase
VNKNSTDDITDFGYQAVEASQKAGKVAEVFHSVAGRYDLMNDLMSLGVHRLWKRFAIDASGVRPGHKVLDVAAGTGDLSSAFLAHVGSQGRVIATDINESMLNLGRDRLLNEGHAGNIAYVLADGQQLPFASNHFDCISIAFGLRNITDKSAALASMFRVLKPGGCLIVLEFSKPVIPVLGPLYDQYSFAIIPKLGYWITGDAPSYQYLVESIRMHPAQEPLAEMMRAVGFDDVEYFNLSGGIVALHRAYKY